MSCKNFFDGNVTEPRRLTTTLERRRAGKRPPCAEEDSRLNPIGQRSAARCSILGNEGRQTGVGGVDHGKQPIHGMVKAMKKISLLVLALAALISTPTKAATIEVDIDCTLGPVQGTFGEGQFLNDVTTFFPSDPIAFDLGDTLVVNILFDQTLNIFDFGDPTREFFTFALNIPAGDTLYSGTWRGSIEALGAKGDIWSGAISGNFTGGGAGPGFGKSALEVTTSEGSITGIRWTTTLTTATQGTPMTLVAFTGVSLSADGILVTPTPIPVSIDIKPGGDPNSINPTSKQKIPVAILTTDDFDALQVDPLSVELGPSGATEVHERGHVTDIDGDGDLDLLLHFDVRDTGIACGDTEATLIGETYSGMPITGSDAISTVGCPRIEDTTIRVLIGDKDCFGLGGACSDGDRYYQDLGGTGDSNRDPGDPLGTDQLGTPVPLGGPTFSIPLDLEGATPLSASLTTFTAGIDLVGATFYFNGTNIGFYVEPEGLENRAKTVVFDVPIGLLTTENTLTLSVPDLGLVQDGFIIDYVELQVETDAGD